MKFALSYGEVKTLQSRESQRAGPNILFSDSILANSHPIYPILSIATTQTGKRADNDLCPCLLANRHDVTGRAEPQLWGVKQYGVIHLMFATSYPARSLSCSRLDLSDLNMITLNPLSLILKLVTAWSAEHPV